MLSATRFLFITGIALCGLIAASEARALNLLTEENPPFNFSDKKKPAGASTEIVLAMAKKAGLETTVQIMPWGRAYEKAQADKETCLYSTARLSNRENAFKWVGPIATNKWALFAKKGFAGQISSLHDVRPYRVGGVRRDAKLEMLRQAGVTNIFEEDDDRRNPPKLTLDRKATLKIDLWVTGAYNAAGIARQAKVADIQRVLVFNDQPLYLACSPRTSNATIEKLSAALDALSKDGTIKIILERHGLD